MRSGFSAAFLAVLVLVGLTGCAGTKIIPEISSDLSDERVWDLTFKKITPTIAVHNNELVLFSPMGEILRWNPESRMVNFLYNLNHPIDPRVFHHRDRVLFRHPGEPAYTVFDLDEMKKSATPGGIRIDRMIAMDHEFLVYLPLDTGKKRVVEIFNYRTGETVRTLNIGQKFRNRVFNAEIRDNQLLLLTSRHLYVCRLDHRDHGEAGALERKELRYRAASGFLRDGDTIYYGSQQRQLVKMSLKSGKIHWTVTVAENLTVAPVKVRNHVVITPEDNNIYFFNTNGTLYWWEKLESSRLLPPLALDENVVVFLWNKKIKFFSHKEKRVSTYPLNRLLKTNPVVVGDYVYVVAGDDEPEEDDGLPAPRELTRIGNHYGVEVNAVPRDVMVMGRSVQFNLKGHNLVEPRYSVKILKQGGGEKAENVEDVGNVETQSAGTPAPVLFEKTIEKDDPPNFVWIPEHAGEYRLVINVEAENIKSLEVEETFTAVDIETMLQQFYYRVQSHCTGHRLE